MNYFLPHLILLLIGFVLPISQHSQPVGNYQVYLPMITSPEVLTPSDEVRVQITPTGGLNSSTFEPHSFVVTNMAGNAQSITYITIDLSTTIFQDMVYDPNGVAGDLTAKNLQVDGNGSGVGFLAHSFAGAHDDGYDQLNIAFNNFDPGETFSFSLDVDPTSIRGVAAPGPFEAGSVSGLELVGATVTVTFADTTQLTGQTYRLPNSVGGSEAVMRSNLPQAPLVQVVGVSGSTAVVTDAQQILEIETSARGTVKALVIEGGLFLDGVPNGGFDLDPFESNSALTVREYEWYSNGGPLNLPIELSRSHAAGGFNMIVVVQENNFGYKGAVSPAITLELQD